MSEHDTHWFKSSRSNGQANCVEVAFAGDVVAVRDSKDPAGNTLTFSRGAWLAFLAGVTGGDLTPR